MCGSANSVSLISKWQAMASFFFPGAQSQLPFSVLLLMQFRRNVCSLQACKLTITPPKSVGLGSIGFL